MRNRTCKNRTGIVLILTIVTLIVLSTMLYTIGSKLAAKIHQDQYVIDYQKAMYACESAGKYAIAMIDELKFELIERPNEPDFSDVFQMTKEQYKEILEQYKQEIILDANIIDTNIYNSKQNSSQPKQTTMSFSDLIKMATADSDLNDSSSDSYEDANDINDINNVNNIHKAYNTGEFDFTDTNDANELDGIYIRGPYGPKWPLVKEPVTLKIGQAEVEIRIEDENAKFPAVWMLITEKDLEKQAETAVNYFLEWMGLSADKIDEIETQVKDMQDIKAFSFNLKPSQLKTKSVKKVSSRSRRKKGRRRRSRKKTVVKTVKLPLMSHRTDFARLFNSTKIDLSDLEKPILPSGLATEVPAKYLGLWGSQRININSAPRAVLEAAFTFGGDEVEIAQAIIEMRRVKPIKTIDELAKQLYQYNDSIEKARSFITTVSSVFTVKITAYSGTARADITVAVMKTKKGAELIAVIKK